MNEPTTFSPAMERFFEEVAKRGPWEIQGRQGYIALCEDPVCCPVLALVGRDSEAFPDDFIEWQERYDVYRAADNCPGHNPALRARLLECCGLAEVKS